MNTNIDTLIEAFLCEAVALTKGSQRVMNDPKLVANLADSIRDDVDLNPSVFPPGFRQQSKKLDDDTLSHWFLENIDSIEKAGYEGTIYSRDGTYSDWIVRKYISGAHAWEDIIGVMNMNMRDWFILKSRNLLQPSHQDIPRFNGVRELGFYMTTHYGKELNDVRQAAASAALKKSAKSAKLVDNDDYRIYTVFNWAASRMLGLGTQWCTANSSDSTNYNTYSSRAMLFQMYPKDPEEIHKKSGSREISGAEKYQFDAGGPHLMDLADHPANKAQFREKFPYVYTDLVTALTQNKEKIEQSLEEMSRDPALQSKETKIRVYDINSEIDKLKRLVEAGWFTNEKRPAKKSSAEQPEQDVPQIAQQNPPQQGQNNMENVDKDVAAMLESLKKYDILKESVAPVLERKKVKEEPVEADAELEEGANKKDVPAFLRKASGKEDWKTSKKDLDKEDEDKMSSKAGLEKAKKEKGITESEEADQEVLEWMTRFSKLGNMKGYGR